MKYYEDTMEQEQGKLAPVRKFNEKIPKEVRKMKVFAKAKVYVYDEEENTIIASRGRWKPSTKAKYDAWIKSTKE